MSPSGRWRRLGGDPGPPPERFTAGDCPVDGYGMLVAWRTHGGRLALVCDEEDHTWFDRSATDRARLPDHETYVLDDGDWLERAATADELRAGGWGDLAGDPAGAVPASPLAAAPAVLDGAPPGGGTPDGLLPEELRALSPEAMLARLTGGDVPPGLDWDDLARVGWDEALGPDTTGAERAVPWARLAVLAYDRLDDVRHAAALRTQLVDRYGHRRGDPVLDGNALARDFLDRHGDGHGEAYAAARADAERWRDLPRERVRELHRTKQELTPLARLADEPGVDATDLRPWLDLRRRLP